MYHAVNGFTSVLHTPLTWHGSLSDGGNMPYIRTEVCTMKTGYKTTQEWKATKWLRHSVFERDSYSCIFCENQAHDIHHVVRRSQGGHTHPHNLVSLCRVCHCRLHDGQTIHTTAYGAVTTSQAVTLAWRYLVNCYADRWAGTPLPDVDFVALAW